MNRPLVHHVTADFPDPLDADKTQAIARLVQLSADGFEHQVWSLNRRSPQVPGFAINALRTGLRPHCEISATPFAGGTALVYQAPPRGIFHYGLLRDLGLQIAERIAAGPRPDLLVGHKLTMEGIAVREAARILGLPYALSIQGDTDTKILAARPDLRARFAKIFHGARVVFPFAPWSLERVEAQLGRRKGMTVLLPCATDLDTPMAPREGGSGFLSVFHLKSRRRKNLRGLVAAMRLLEAGGNAPQLAIAGGGSAADRSACERSAERTQSIQFLGALPREVVRSRMNGAVAFVLPSLRESFGLVFVEALFAGCPIIYPKGHAVDGYFGGAAFAIAVDARDPAEIAEAMRRALRDEAALKAELAQWQLSNDALRFTRTAIGKSFAEGLQSAIQPDRKERR